MGCFHTRHAQLADETLVNTVKPSSLDDAIRHLRNIFQEDENRVEKVVDDIELLRKEPQLALDSLAKDFMDAFGSDEQDTSPQSAGRYTLH